MIKCKICGSMINGSLGLSSHLRHKHVGYTVKKYYDEFYKKEKEGRCLTCGKPTKFRNFKYGYNKFCNSKCAQRNKETREKFKATCLKNLGVDNPNKLSSTIDKRRQTCLDKYGVDSFMKTKEFREIAIETIKSEEVQEKRKQTNLERYGVEMPFQSPKIQKKIKQTNLERYGVENPYQSPEIMQNKGNSHEARSKASETMRKNGNRSSLEDKLEIILKNNNIDYKKEYDSDKRYPFLCDFYLPKKDLFIEINGFTSHGGHWFNGNDPKDIEKVNNWKYKSNGHDLYSKFICGWTVRDVKKREAARENNLNYVVLWNEEDIDLWFSLGCPIGKDWKEEYTWKG